MGAITYEMETRSPVPAAKMFKAFVLDSDTLIPKIMPQAIKKVEILEGDGGVGTVKIIHFGEGSQFKSVKHRVDAIDTENLSHSYSILEGDALMGVIESIAYHIKIVPTEDGGCVCKNTSIYHTKEGVEIDEEKIKEGKEKAMVMFKAIEAYLQANPDA
ncbi:major allergen pru ar 1 [Phtheirospermum japonicum]|uniref:Major allergen pru ar 1 n=1 Tax=Phtheirospermum japonicum TaxID=374723 RepID=A0A830B8K2_9LAMI|nr:major allergen pru ar 1 [Phtheirospermum japonicum]